MTELDTSSAMRFGEQRVNSRVVVLDTETTGFSPIYDRIVEIAAIEVSARTGEIGAHFHEVLNPERHIPVETTRIHGISDADVRDKLSFSNIASRLSEFLAGSTLLIHNSAFDIAMLDAALVRAGKRPTEQLGVSVVDTVEMAKAILPLLTSYNLDALCDEAGINRDARTTHGAFLDARLLAQVLPYLAARYDSWAAAVENDCGIELVDFLDKLDKVATPLLRETNGAGKDIAHDLGAVVTLHRWLPKVQEALESLCKARVEESGWYCKHLFARYESKEIFNYKDAALALLGDYDLAGYQTRSFVYRVAPSLNDEVQALLDEVSFALNSPRVMESKRCLVRALVIVKQLRRLIEKRRETLRRQFLDLTQQGFTTEQVSVTESARTTTDYRRALGELMPNADLQPFARTHIRLSVGERSLETCTALFA